MYSFSEAVFQHKIKNKKNGGRGREDCHLSF